MNAAPPRPKTADLLGWPPRSAFKRKWTYTQACAELPETLLPIEIWDGILVLSRTPVVLHQCIVGRLTSALGQWVKRRRLGIVLHGPLDVVLEQDLVLQPDALFIAKDRLDIIQRHVLGAPDLVAEVVSSDRRERDYKDKRERYEEHGVKEYWILDPERKCIEVWVREEDFFALQGHHTGRQFACSALLPGFKIRVDLMLANS